MTPDLMQDATVTLIAIAAAAMIFRRVIGFAQPSKPGRTACSSCASRCPAPVTGGQPAASAEPAPVHLLRRSSRQPT